ncbi:hypothetical protein DPMN_177971 [Dreissena polymorpha]|uniref:Uncharacterized protein n=1 Tax=Dreissena polymorpha TaxID=45954 RepID=A0A9D4EB97_DREPO|nr:hypothetical protein DPMN_177971 [Dreissena polymorpha]
MFDDGVEYLDPEQKNKFAKLLYKYQDVFAKSSDDLGCTNVVKHKINTESANSIVLDDSHMEIEKWNGLKLRRCFKRVLLNRQTVHGLRQ